MYARFHFVSEAAKKVTLSAAFDSPPDGLTRKECHAIIKILAETKKKLERTLGYGTVRLSLDDYSSSVFWFIVLQRLIDFDPDNPVLGKRAWTVYELCLKPELARKLKQTDLGLVYDETRNWLVLIWPEAISGILDRLKDIPDWKRILEHEKTRLGEVTIEWWKACAQAHSFVVPPWRLFRLDYLHQVLWHRPGLTYADITVFDLAGIDIPIIDQKGLVTLPVAKRARFVHFYTEDKREFQEAQKVLDLRAQRDPKVVAHQEATQQWKLEQKRKKLPYWRASRCIRRVFFLCGGDGKLRAHLRKYLDADEADRLYNNVIDQLINGYQVKKVVRVNALLDELKTYLSDPLVPRNFEKWLILKDGGKGAFPTALRD